MIFIRSHAHCILLIAKIKIKYSIDFGRSFSNQEMNKVIRIEEEEKMNGIMNRSNQKVYFSTSLMLDGKFLILFLECPFNQNRLRTAQIYAHLIIKRGKRMNEKRNSLTMCNDSDNIQHWQQVSWMVFSLWTVIFLTCSDSCLFNEWP